MALVKCPECGGNVSDKAENCVHCGYPLLRNVNAASIANATQTETTVDVTQESLTEGQSGVQTSAVENTTTRNWKIPAAIAIIVAVAAGIWFAYGNLANYGKDIPTDNVAVYATRSADGTAYIALADGTVITINEEVNDAVITPDRAHVIVHLNDGSLYVTDINQTSKHEITDNAGQIYAVRNDGVFYTDRDHGYTNEALYRANFSDYTSQEVYDGDYARTFADHSTTILYADDGNVYMLDATDTDAEKIGTYEGEIRLLEVSDDGNLAVWDDISGHYHTVSLYNNEDTDILGEFYSDNVYMDVTASRDQELWVIGGFGDCDRLWILPSGKDPIEVELGTDYMSNLYFTNKDRLSYTDAKDITSLYLFAGEDILYNDLYEVSLDGDYNRMDGYMYSVEIYDGMIAYKNIDADLYVAQLDADQLSDQTRISSDADSPNVIRRYMYYLKNEDDMIGTLYCYRYDIDKSVKVSTDVYASYGVTEDGSTIYFLTNCDMDEYTGTLMTWSYGDDEPTMIDEIRMYSTMTGLEERGNIWPVGSQGFTYMTIDGVHKRYDGRKATEIKK